MGDGLHSVHMGALTHPHSCYIFSSGWFTSKLFGYQTYSVKTLSLLVTNANAIPNASTDQSNVIFETLQHLGWFALLNDYPTVVDLTDCRQHQRRSL